MFNIFNKTVTEPTPLEIAIDRLMEDMSAEPSDSKKYDAMSTQLVKLMRLQKETKPSWQPSADALLACATNLAGILLILNFERVGVIASKALGFIGKLR